MLRHTIQKPCQKFPFFLPILDEVITPLWGQTHAFQEVGRLTINAICINKMWCSQRRAAATPTSASTSTSASEVISNVGRQQMRHHQAKSVQKWGKHQRRAHDARLMATDAGHHSTHSRHHQRPHQMQLPYQMLNLCLSFMQHGGGAAR